jgi:hypothetical protein
VIDEIEIKIDGSVRDGSQERRRDARRHFTATVEAVESKSQTRIQGRTSDLSRGGCYLDTITSFPVGSILKIRILKGTRSFEAPAEVVYSLVGMGMGVKFIYADPNQLRISDELMDEFSGESLPAQGLLQSTDRLSAQRGPREAEYQVLHELVLELMSQCVLSNTKGESMLQRLNRTGIAMSNPSHACVWAS